MVCKEDDEYVRHKVRWVVQLSNGETVYQDDNRPGLAEPSAWKRLKVYCRQEDVAIVAMAVQFHTHRIDILPARADGYFFAHGVIACTGDGETHQACVTGIVSEDEVHTTTWKIPELMPLATQTRPIEFDSPFIIFNNPQQSQQ